MDGRRAISREREREKEKTQDPPLVGFGGEGCHFYPRKILVEDATDLSQNLKATTEGEFFNALSGKAIG